MRAIFISSVQHEFVDERRALAEYIRTDALLGKQFTVFLFEELPATDRRPDGVYLDQVEESDVYVGLFGHRYGSEDADGISPTEREFDRATTSGLSRYVFLSGKTVDRDPKMQQFVQKAEAELVRRSFTGVADLISQVYASLIGFLEEKGVIATRPLDAAAHPEAALDEVSAVNLSAFLERARAARGYPLDPDTPVEAALAHMKMLDHGRPSNAALLLFGEDSQLRFPSSETKCLHFHGTEVRKPIPSYQLYKGSLFQQVDSAIDFVLSKLARAIGTREESVEASRTYEIPPAVIQEAIVNAIAHRDYASTAGVQVHVFADRIEVMNPGALPEGVSLEELRRPHASHPRSPLIADALYLTHYIEKAGTGTLDMIAGCREADLPEPEFREQGDHFVLTLWRDWLTEEVMNRLELSDRQKNGVALARALGRVSNADLRRELGVSKPTATRDLERLVDVGVFEKIGSTGVGTHYVISRKGLRKGSMGSDEAKGS